MLAALSDTVIELLIGAALIVALLIFFLFRSYLRRDEPTVLRKLRFGVFIERDLLNPDDLPKLPEWPHSPPDPPLYPTEETKSHDSPTDA